MNKTTKRVLNEAALSSIEDFRHYLEMQGRAYKTISLYTRAAILFYSFYEELNIVNLKFFREYLIENYPVNTVNTRIYGMNRYLDYLLSVDQIPPSLIYQVCGAGADASSSPAPVRASKNGIYRLQPVIEQHRCYLDTVISQRDYEKLKRCLKKDGNLYWYFVIRFLGATGARVSELLQIKAEDLRLGYLDLYTKGGKIRRLYFPRSLCSEAIPFYRERGIQSGFIFLNQHGQLITPRGIEFQLKAFAKRYHIDPDTVYPHSFRHRFAKNFLKRFNDLSLLADLMGHDSIETTRVYLTRTSHEQKSLLDRIITW
ncbi:integrase [Clostridiaceae bacterium]|nr:tyrosine-type recombinase/integrase [Clostridium sp.]NBI71852.1 integrase [Clostridiaceae bacterium]